MTHSILPKLARSREKLLALVSDLSEEALDQHLPDGWTIRATLTHLLNAEEDHCRISAVIASGEIHRLPPAVDIDAYNAERLAARGRLTRDALFAALATCAVVYILIQLLVTAVLPASSQTDRPLAAAAHFFLGNRGAAIMTAAILLSVYGLLGANMLTVPRLMFALAERGDFPSLLGKIHPQYRTPYVSILAFALFVWLFSLRGSFQWNLTLSAVARLVYYGSVCAALPVLRRRQAPEAKFRLPAGSLFAVLGIGLSLLLLTRVDRSGMIALVAVTILALANGIWARRYGRAVEPVADSL